MKTKLFILISILFTSSVFGNTQNAEALKTELKETLSKVFPSSKFSIENFTPNTSAKSFEGVGTFFGKKNIKFSGAYISESAIGSVNLEFAEKSKIKIKNKNLVKFAGENLSAYLPADLIKTVYLGGLGINLSKTDKNIADLNITLKSRASWQPMSSQSLKINDVNVNFFIKHPNDKNKRVIETKVNGHVVVAGKAIPITGFIPKNKTNLQLTATIPQLQLKESMNIIGGKIGLQDIPIPTTVINLSLKEAKLNVWPNKDEATLDANSNWGTVSSWFKKSTKKQKKLDYVVTINPPKDFKLSKISEKLKVLDAVNLSGQKIVLSSTKVEKEKTSKIPSLAQFKTGLTKGCQLVSKLDLTKLKLDHFLKVKELVVSSPLSSNLSQVKLESTIDKNIQIGDNATLNGITFRLSPSPKNFAIALMGSLQTKLGNDELTFIGGMELVVNNQTMNFVAMMKGEWKNPLGVNGIIMQDLGIQLGGSFGGATILPNFAFSGNLRIGRFSGSATVALDSRRPDKSMISAKLAKLYLSDVINSVIDRKIAKRIPKPLTSALNSIRLNKLYAEVVPTNMTVLEKYYEAGFRMGGNIDFFGINGYANLDINYRTGVYGDGGVDPIDLGAFKLKGANGKPKPGLVIDLQSKGTPKVAINGSVSLLGVTAETDIETVENGLKFMVGGKIFNLFQGKIYASATNLQKLESIYAKVEMQQDLFNFIQNDARKFVEKNIGGAIAKLTDGQNAIRKEERKLASVDREIVAMRQVVVKDQAGDRAKLQKAENDVNNAQKKVNTLQSQINNLEKSKSGKNIIQKAAIETKIKGLQIAKGTAWGVLEGYEQTLKFIRKKVIVNPDLDPRMIGLKSKKGIAIGALKTAEGSLQAIKLTLGLTGNVASFVMKNGPDALVNIKRAHFEGGLGSLSNAKVNLQLELVWLKKSHKVALGFDFNNPQKMIADLGKKLMALK